MKTTTTITIDRKLKDRLDALKLSRRESYNEVLARVLKAVRTADPEAIAETIEILSDPEIMRDLAQSLEDLRAGRVYSIDEV